jgi:exodeoxyribonuclease-5
MAVQEMVWSQQQEDALQAVEDWLRRGDRPVFRLFGFAGSGKTTLAKYFGDSIGNVVYGAFSGKAAHVMAQKGCIGATTIHKQIYKPNEKSRMRLRELEDDMADLRRSLSIDSKLKEEQIDRHPDVIRLRDEITDEGHRLKKPSWMLNPESSVKAASLFTIDEVSMVGERMGEDMMSFGVPLLVLGDPAQLPPVFGEGFFINGRPDVLLTEIHRQARDNPIIKLSFDVRTGKGLRFGQYGESKVINREQVNRDDLLSHDQVLVGKNKTRKQFNARIRQLRGFTDPMPMKGDRLVCLRNNHELGLLNGSIWYVTESFPGVDNDATIELALKSEDGDTEIVCTAHKAYFLGEEPPFYTIKEFESFDFAYAMTVHKAKGHSGTASISLTSRTSFVRTRPNIFTPASPAPHRKSRS